MKIEDADIELKQLAEKVFKVAELLTNDTPIFQSSGWYKCGSPIVAWFYLIGPRGKKHPANSVLVTATKNDKKLLEVADKMGNNMYGEKTLEYVVHNNDPVSFAGYLEFIACAFKARVDT